MFNQVMLVGRLTKDPELRYTSAGAAVAHVTLAVNRSFKMLQVKSRPITSIAHFGEKQLKTRRYIAKKVLSSA